MRKISILALAILTSSTLYAADIDHTGEHMHEGKMTNHEKEATSMSDMDHSKMNHGSSSMATSAYHNQMSKDGYDFTMMSEKPLVRGSNKITVILEKDGKFVEDAKVRVKFFMPEMPGMPYMESKSKGMKMGDKYHMDINLGMSGTWQYHLEVKTSDGKVHKTRGSVNL